MARTVSTRNLSPIFDIQETSAGLTGAPIQRIQAEHPMPERG